MELYLKGYEFTDIKRNTRHSSESIARYPKEFARVAALHKEGYSLDQRLVKEYWSCTSDIKMPRTASRGWKKSSAGIPGKKNLGVERARAKGVT